MQHTIQLRLYKLTWDAPVNDGGSSIIDYQILITTNIDTTDWLNLNSTDTRLLMLLPENMALKAEVRAVNAVGPGEAASVRIKPMD